MEVRRLLTDRLRQFTPDRNLLLIIDDAQLLHPEAMFGLKYVTDLERRGNKICTALLLGSPEIQDLL